MTKEYQYHSLSAEKTFSRLVSGREGLSQDEAKARLAKYGPNRLPKDKPLSDLRLFFDQFRNPLIYILLAAIVVSALSGHGSDAAIITAVVLVTNAFGFWQERKANRALAQLSHLVVHKIRVRRNGQTMVIVREELVPGDVIELAAGEIIPADARLFELRGLRVNEAPLTGESLPAKKSLEPLPLDSPLADRHNLVFQGTIVSEGSGSAVVVATGMNTEIGRVAEMIRQTADPATPLQKQISRFGSRLGIFLVVANIIIFAIGVLSGRPVFEMFLVAVVVVVSAVPEGLIPAMSIILAIGMQRLSKKNGLVRRALAAETLGSVGVICVDKTGTLTQGEMQADRLITPAGIFEFDYEGDKSLSGDKNSSLILKISALCNEAIVENPDEERGEWKINGSPTDRALLAVSGRFGFARRALEISEPRLAALPFTSDLKLMATLHKSDGNNQIAYIKGAPERLLALADSLDEGGQPRRFRLQEKEKLAGQVAQLASLGERVIAFGYKRLAGFKPSSLAADSLQDMTLVGFISLKDQVRPDVKEAINLCRRASLRTVIITGDHLSTASAIAGELGFSIDEKNSITGAELDQLSDEQFKRRVKSIRLYARVDPRHKLRIVAAFQELGKVVAMTGDGINDAPALKKADIGVAVGTGTDVAKETADLVLLDNRFLTIVEAVRQGRITFSNIRKVVLYLFTDCFQEMVIIGTSVIFGWPLPILPVQVLWIKMIEDPLPAASLAFDGSQEDVMKEKPRPRHQPILTKEIQKIIFFYALIMNIAALSIFYYFWHEIGDLARARSVVFATLGLSTMVYVYAVRGLKKSVFRINPLSNRFLVGATGLGFLLILVSIYLPWLNRLLSTVPLPASDWLFPLGYAALSLFVFEVGKKLAHLGAPRKD